MDRTTWDSPEREREKELIVLRRAEARWRDALARYERPNIPEEKIRAAQEVVERARRNLL
jgi:trimethylamine:corrinoid methyltransferase-like protein